MRRFGLLVLFVSACGQTGRDGARDFEPDRAGAGGGGSSGAPSVSNMAGAAAMPGGADSGGAPERNCLFPVVGLQVAPGSDRPAQPSGLSQPYPIDLASERIRFAAAYEVNGDAVSDLLLLDREASPPRFRLLLTSQPPDVLELVESDCGALRSLPAGRLLLRDLDGDSVQDFVIGGERGVFAYFNREEGLEEVLSHAWPSPTDRAPLINLGLADLNGDEQADLVLSVDRVFGEGISDFEMRVVAFLQEEGGFAAGQTLLAGFSGEPAEGSFLYSGYLTAGRFKPEQSGTALLIGYTQSPSNSDSLLEARFNGSEPRPLRALLGEPMQQVLAVPRADALSLALVVGETQFGLVEFSDPLPSNPQTFGPKLVTQGKLAFRAGPSHELGGGSESPRHFVYDVDRDGDLDFLESNPADAKLALHVNHDNQTFDAPQLLDITVWGEAETPFIQVGPRAAIIGAAGADGAGAAVYILAPGAE